MSTNATNVVLINGNNYEVEIYLLRDVGEVGGIVPIDYSNIKYMEITNDLANIGYYGKIAFTNFYSILDQLGVIKASSKIPLMYFRLKSLSIANRDGSTYDDIYFIAALTEGQDIKENEIEGITSYNFEDLYVFKLKTTRAIREDNQTNNYNSVESSVPVNKILKQLLRFNTLAVDENDPNFPVEVDGELIDPTISREIIETGTPTQDAVKFSKIISLKKSTLLYDAINQAIAYFGYKSDGSTGDEYITDWLDPGLIKLENSFTNKGNNSRGSRKFVMFPLLGTIKKFFTALSTGRWDERETDPTKKYYSKFLLEKFNISQKDNSPVFSFNTIPKYELKRVNLPEVLGKKWEGKTLVYGTECCGTESMSYDRMRYAFEKMCTVPFASNLPAANDSQTEYFKSDIPYRVAHCYGTNSVLKSFVFDNVLLTFRVEGQPYRKPNRFIAVNTAINDKELNPIKSKEKSEVDGFWYVLSVNHVFINGNYFNDFECVKLYDLNGTLGGVRVREGVVSAGELTGGDINGVEDQIP